MEDSVMVFEEVELNRREFVMGLKRLEDLEAEDRERRTARVAEGENVKVSEWFESILR